MKSYSGIYKDNKGYIHIYVPMKFHKEMLMTEKVSRKYRGGVFFTQLYLKNKDFEMVKFRGLIQA